MSFCSSQTSSSFYVFWDIYYITKIVYNDKKAWEKVPLRCWYRVPLSWSPAASCQTLGKFLLSQRDVEKMKSWKWTISYIRKVLTGCSVESQILHSSELLKIWQIKIPENPKAITASILSFESDKSLQVKVSLVEVHCYGQVFCLKNHFMDYFTIGNISYIDE